MHVTGIPSVGALSFAGKSLSDVSNPGINPYAQYYDYSPIFL